MQVPQCVCFFAGAHRSECSCKLCEPALLICDAGELKIFMRSSCACRTKFWHCSYRRYHRLALFNRVMFLNLLTIFCFCLVGQIVWPIATSTTMGRTFYATIRDPSPPWLWPSLADDSTNTWGQLKWCTDVCGPLSSNLRNNVIRWAFGSN